MSKARRAQNFTGGLPDEPNEDGPDGAPPVETNPASPPPGQVHDGDVPTPSRDAYPEAPTQPGFAMSDEPFEGRAEAHGDPAAGALGDPVKLAPGVMFDPAMLDERTRAPLDGEIIPPQKFGEVDAISRTQQGGIRYEGRIRVLDAFQYNGDLSKAPEWVDRNWLAYGDHDPLRGIEPGPALRVPLPSGQHVMCRIGDYVVQQSVRLTADHPGDMRLEVWAKDDFRKNFLPVNV